MVDAAMGGVADPFYERGVYRADRGLGRERMLANESFVAPPDDAGNARVQAAQIVLGNPKVMQILKVYASDIADLDARMDPSSSEYAKTKNRLGEAVRSALAAMQVPGVSTMPDDAVISTWIGNAHRLHSDIVIGDPGSVASGGTGSGDGSGDGSGSGNPYRLTPTVPVPGTAPIDQGPIDQGPIDQGPINPGVSGDSQDPFSNAASAAFLGSEEGRYANFTDFIKGLNPGGSRWLSSGIQNRYNPLEDAYLAEAALGTIPMRVEGQFGEPGTPIDFRQYLDTTGIGAPSQNKWESILSGVSDWLTGPRDVFGAGSKISDYALDEDNQFQLAFNSILQQIPYHLRPAAKKTAARSFNQFRSQNPARMDEWLPAWREQGQNWNPTLTPRIQQSMGQG